MIRGSRPLLSLRDWSLERQTASGAVPVLIRSGPLDVADLLVSRRVHAGETVLVDRLEGREHLHFTVAEQPDERTLASPFVLEIPVS